MDTQRTEGQPSDKLNVIVVDENLCHANIARCMLAKLEYRVMVYISPIEALKFLKDHGQDVDFGLVAVNMKEMHGFQFLEISRELQKNFQVIMMSTDTTWDIMKRCVELGARFLVKKPLDTNIVNNLWQYLDLKVARMEKIKYLFQGIEGTTHDVSCLESEKSVNKCGDGTKQKTNLMWTPYLESKFASALELLGEGATPKQIQLVMNIKSINLKNISAHLQKHRKKIQKELCNKSGTMCNTGASSSQPLRTCETGPNTQYDPYIQPAVKTDEEMTSDQTESFTEETEGNKVYYRAIQRALRLGTVFDESQLRNYQTKSFTEETEGNKGEVDKMADGGDAQVDNTFAFGGGDQTGVVKLVAYSDSEDDVIDP